MTKKLGTPVGILLLMVVGVVWLNTRHAHGKSELQRPAKIIMSPFKDAAFAVFWRQFKIDLANEDTAALAKKISFFGGSFSPPIGERPEQIEFEACFPGRAKAKLLECRFEDFRYSNLPPEFRDYNGYLISVKPFNEYTILYIFSERGGKFKLVSMIDIG